MQHEDPTGPPSDEPLAALHDSVTEREPGPEPAAGRTAERRRIDRRIASLAVPALGALIAEPLFLAVDSALVGHLGAVPLAGLAIAAAVLQTAVGLMIFLAYATTPLVARRRGAGDLRGAVQAGVDGLWLALAIGALLGVALWAASEPLVRLFGSDAAAHGQAHIYLAISCAGLPAMLVVFAAMGLLRGLQDTHTPLYVAGVGFAANALLNWWFIYGLGWGIAGSAWGTVIAQWGMVLVYLVVIHRHVRAHGAEFWPKRTGLAQAGRSGGWLFIRTIGLRAALLLTVAAASSHGTVATAGYQVMFTMFSMAMFALDALAIAAQALVGDSLGARRADEARAVLRRTLLWGFVSGTAMGAVTVLASPLIGYIFTSDLEVLDVLPAALVVLGISMPLCGIVFVLDGVLMGAGDARYLAWTSLVNLAVYAPVLWVITALPLSEIAALITLTAGFTLLFMSARAVTLGVRARGNRWMRLGV